MTVVSVPRPHVATALGVLITLLLPDRSVPAQQPPPLSHMESILGDGGIVRLPTNPNSTQSWHLYALQQLGLDRQHGFELQLVPAATTQATANALQSGAANVALFSWIEAARMKKAGISLVGVGPFLQWGANQIVAPAGTTYRNIGDLKGKKIGIFRRSSIDWIIDQILAKTVYHMDVDRDIVAQEGAIGLLRGLLESGQLDAAHMFNNLTPSMIATGKFRVMEQTRDTIKRLGLPEIPDLIYFVSTDYAAAHPQNVRAFLAAYREAVQALRTDDNLWTEFGKTLQMPDGAIWMLRDEMRVDLWSAFKPTTAADIQTIFDFLTAHTSSDILALDGVPSDLITSNFQ
jgi:NitT/TauT family transport system substrate-binding protein